MKTQDLIGPALKWAVAMAEGKAGDCEVHAGNVWYGRVTSGFVQDNPDTNWCQGGPIVERCKGYDGIGPTLLIAAMRCYVASKLGDEVDVPEELLP